MIDNLKYYDNFVIPIDTSRLQNERVKLVPFEVGSPGYEQHFPPLQAKFERWHEDVESDFEKYSKTYVAETSANPAIVDYLPYGPWPNVSEFEFWYDPNVRTLQTNFWFAIILHKGVVKKQTRGVNGSIVPDKFETFEVEEGTMAGVTGLCRADPANSVVEIGHVLVFPAFWGSFVNATAHGLILQHLLDPAPDLHCRRVQWQANARNEPSKRAALRLGFHFEGTMRWQRILNEGRLANTTSDRDTLTEPQRSALPATTPTGQRIYGGRHSAMFSLCWDDWLDGGKEKVLQLMAKYT